MILLTRPFDYAHVRLATDVGKERTFEGTLDCWKKTNAANGPTSIYKGALAPMIGAKFGGAVKLAVFDTIMGLNPYERDHGVLGFITGFLSAQISRAFGSLVTYPFFTVSRRLMMTAE